MANDHKEFVVTGNNLHIEGLWEVDFGNLTRTGRQWHPIKGEMIRRCMPALRQLTRNKAKATCIGLKSALTTMVEFIDLIDAASFERSPSSGRNEKTFKWSSIENIWPNYIVYMRIKEATDTAKYRLTANLCRVLRAAHLLDTPPQQRETELRVEPHFYSSKSHSYSGDEVSLEDAANLFRGLGKLFLASLNRINECQTLLLAGSDPRSAQGGWGIFANRLWAISNLFPAPEDRTNKEHESIRSRLNYYSIPDQYRIDILDADKRFYTLKYFSCLEFTRTEISLALALVASKTGFNPDALARMSLDDWKRQSLVDAESRIVIQAKKRGGSYYLTSTSSKSKRLDPYRVIQEVIAKQQHLRDQLNEEAEKNDDPHLASRARLVWVFRDAFGNVKDLSGETVGGGGLFREAGLINSIIKRIGLKNSNGVLMDFDFSTARDTWALFTYRKSNANLLLTAKALGHRTIESLLYYLEKRHLIIEDKKKLIDLQNQIFADLSSESFDVLELRSRLQGLPVSSKGLKCTDPRNPTGDGDPGHKEGSICIAQNCISCTRWIADARSVPHLMRMESDLILIRSKATGAAWLASSHSTELALIQHILSKFSPKLIEICRSALQQMPCIIPLTSVGLGRK